MIKKPREFTGLAFERIKRFECVSCDGIFYVNSDALPVVVGGPGTPVMCCPFCGVLAGFNAPGEKNEDDSIAGRIRRFIEDLLERKPKFHGSVQANFSIGGLTNVNTTESTKGNEI